MKLLWLTRKNDMILIALISSLTLWSLTASILAFQNKTKLVLIGKVGNSYQLITDKGKRPRRDNKLYKTLFSLNS